ncbi:MAG: SLC13 family permease [Acidimicrobiia bacterium]|nr:SLC13 family permease [Acidimicrobiia bacterium]
MSRRGIRSSSRRQAVDSAATVSGTAWLRVSVVIADPPCRRGRQCNWARESPVLGFSSGPDGRSTLPSVTTGPSITTRTPSRTRDRNALRTRRSIGLGLGLFVLVLPWFLNLEGLSEPGHRMLGVFLMAIVLWVTEAIPLYATAALIIFLQILFISDQALWDLPAGFEAPTSASYFATLAHPVLMLFLGGFFLAEGAARYRLDRNLARIMLRPFGDSPAMIVLGLMVITAAFSMFMSNTATTATFLAVVLPVVATLEPGDRLRVALVMAIPLAANIGGIATPVGTPPNAIAIGSLEEAGISVSFIRWMALATPAMIVLLLFGWQLIVRLFPASTERLTLNIEGSFDQTRPALVFYLTAAATIVLWLSEPIHGVSASVVGFMPVVVLLATGVLDSKDLQKMPWHVLWLVAGGVALGLAVNDSGLDRWLIDQVGWDAVPVGLLALALAFVATSMSTVISNSAAANLLIPIGLTLTVSGTVDLEPLAAGFFIAIGASLAMALPVSTPPNAIAYSTGALTTGAMARVGLAVGVVGLALFVFIAPLLWELMGVSP